MRRSLMGITVAGLILPLAVPLLAAGGGRARVPPHPAVPDTERVSAYRESVGPARPAPVQERRFHRELDRLRAAFGLPGATAAFIDSDGRLHTAASGLSDVEEGIPMTPASRMLAGSIGKTFVAATVLALAGEGTLRLDDPVATWLGDRAWFRRLPNHASLTVRQLLTHSGGLPDHVTDEGFARAWADRRMRPFPPDSLVAFILDRPPLFAAGEGWSYSDTGYVLLGLIVERATGATLFGEIDRRFLTPLRLRSTSPSDRVELPGLAAGYVPADDPYGLPRKTTNGPGRMVWDPGVEWAGGGLVSTSADLAVWARALYEGRAMPRPYLAELFRSVAVDGGGGSLRYGAGVVVTAGGPLGPSWGHGGVIPGYISSVRHYPEHGVTVAFQVNGPPAAGSPDGADFRTVMESRLAHVAAGLP